MKKIYCLIVVILLVISANATNYYVDLSLTTSGDGLSWQTAFKSVAAAETAADLNAGVDNIFVKGNAFAINYNWSLKAEKYYFSCAGTEVSPSDRPMNDNDGNGIIEPWEFKYPTVCNNTNVGNGPVMGSSTLVDGLTIKHTATRSNGIMTSLTCPDGAIFQNGIISGGSLTYTEMASNNGGCLVKVLGTFQNCLIEKNTIKIVNNTATDIKIAPILEANISGTANVKVSNCIIRNNIVSIDYSSGTSNITNLRGMALNFTCSTSVSTVVFSNCIIYNNEFSYAGNATYPVADRAALSSSLSYSSNITNGKLINCTFANNKLTNMKSGIIAFSNASVFHFIYNNVLWNNQNTNTSTGITAGVSMNSSSAQNASTVISNNVFDVPTSGNWGTLLTYTNNLNDLSKLNTGEKAPFFKNPTLFVGANRTAGSADSTAISNADWRLEQGSYLAAKGVTTSVLVDKAGNTYTATPAAGAYEYMFPTAIENIKQDAVFGKVLNNTFIPGIDAKLDIYSLQGKSIKSLNVIAGQVISLPKGVYIVKAKTAQGSFVHKIIL